MLTPNWFDHTSLGLALATVALFALAAWALWFVWKVTH